MINIICVYAGSSDKMHPEYLEAARQMGNRIANYNGGMTLGGGLVRGCSPVRNADNLVAAYNLLVLDNDYAPCSINSVAFGLNGSYDDPEYFTEDIYVYNNMILDLSPTSNWGVCAYQNNDVPQGGSGDPSSSTFVFSGNTCYSDDWGNGPNQHVITIDIEDDKPRNWVISGNIFAGGTDGENLIYIDSPLESLTSDYNVFENSGDTSFSYLGQTYGDLAQFAAASGTNANSKGEGQNPCFVSFLNEPSDLHLGTGDTCAQEAGTSLSSYFTDDYDGDSRPQSTYWDIGADEYASGYTPEGACCDSGCSITTEVGCSGEWLGAGESCSPDPCAPPDIPSTSGLAEGVSISGVKKE